MVGGTRAHTRIWILGSLAFGCQRVVYGPFAELQSAQLHSTDGVAFSFFFFFFSGPHRLKNEDKKSNTARYQVLGGRRLPLAVGLLRAAVAPSHLPSRAQINPTHKAGRQAAGSSTSPPPKRKIFLLVTVGFSNSKQQQQQPTSRTPRRYDKYLAQNMLQWMTGLSNLCRDNSSNGGETSHQPTEGLEVLVVGSAEEEGTPRTTRIYARCYHSSSENGYIEYVSTICWFHLGWPATSSSRPRTKRRLLRSSFINLGVGL